MRVENVTAQALFPVEVYFPARNFSSCATFPRHRIQKCWEEFMEQVMRPVGVVDELAIDDAAEPSVSGVSWAAVLAGAVASLALTLVLLSLGAGLGFSVVSPWANSGVSATSFEIGTGLYFIVMAMISSAIGGYLAGRLRNRWIGVQSTEVLFRDRTWFPGVGIGFRGWCNPSSLSRHLVDWRCNVGRGAGQRFAGGSDG